jgi:hypothetical protein
MEQLPDKLLQLSEGIKNKPLEYRKNQVSLLVKDFRAKKIDLDRVLILAVLIGGTAGLEWIREEIPRIYREKYCKKNRRLNLPKKTLVSIESAVLGPKYLKKTVRSQNISKNQAA